MIVFPVESNTSIIYRKIWNFEDVSINEENENNHNVANLLFHNTITESFLLQSTWMLLVEPSIYSSPTLSYTWVDLASGVSIFVENINLKVLFQLFLESVSKKLWTHFHTFDAKFSWCYLRFASSQLVGNSFLFSVLLGELCLSFHLEKKAIFTKMHGSLKVCVCDMIWWYVLGLTDGSAPTMNRQVARQGEDALSI